MNSVMVTFVHPDAIERFQMLAKRHLLMPMRLLIPTAAFALLGHYLRIVVLFGWPGSSVVCWVAIVFGMGYYTFVAAETVQALYETNIHAEGATQKWGSLAMRYVKQHTVEVVAAHEVQ